MFKTGCPKKMSWHRKFAKSLPITFAKSILKNKWVNEKFLPSIFLGCDCFLLMSPPGKAHD